LWEGRTDETVIGTSDLNGDGFVTGTNATAVCDILLGFCKKTRKNDTPYIFFLLFLQVS